MIKKTNGYLDEMIMPPGETIKEMLEDRDMNQEELAIRLDMSTKHVSQIITGKKPITYQTALKNPKGFIWLDSLDLSGGMKKFASTVISCLRFPISDKNAGFFSFVFTALSFIRLTP